MPKMSKATSLFKRCSSLFQTQNRTFRWKVTKYLDKPMTYEDYHLPYQIGERKSWNSFNASALSGIRQAEHVHEDLFIRKFVHGTFPTILASPVIIKRRGNLINLALICSRRIIPRKFYFLVGYTEEILSYILKCPVRIDIQIVKHEEELTYKCV